MAWTMPERGLHGAAPPQSNNPARGPPQMTPTENSGKWLGLAPPRIKALHIALPRGLKTREIQLSCTAGWVMVMVIRDGRMTWLPPRDVRSSPSILPGTPGVGVRGRIGPRPPYTMLCCAGNTDTAWVRMAGDSAGSARKRSTGPGPHLST